MVQLEQTLDFQFEMFGADIIDPDRIDDIGPKHFKLEV